MLNFFRKFKDNLYRGLCEQAVAQANKIIVFLDDVKEYDQFCYHLKNIKYHYAQAKKYYNKIKTWEYPSDSLNALVEIRSIEKYYSEFSDMTFDEFREIQENMELKDPI